MSKILPYETLKELIQKFGFGTYRVYSLPGNYPVAGSHLMADADTDAKMKPDELVLHLSEAIDLLGDGTYKIVLKKSNKSQNNTEVAYHFEVRTDRNDNSAGSIVTPALAGLGADKIEELVNNRLQQLIAAKEAEWEQKRKVDALEREIAELKKRKPVRKKQNDLQSLINLGLVFGSAFVSEQWPGTKPMIEKALGAIATMGGEDEDEDGEDDDDSTFKRPE
jgi:hypothetical protein